jgi:hypothetical protein
MGYPKPAHRDEAAMNGAQIDLQGSAGRGDGGGNLGHFGRIAPNSVLRETMDYLKRWRGAQIEVV